MTHEQAWKLSSALGEAGFAHTVTVGISENLAENPTCRVEVSWPRRFALGSVRDAVEVLDEIARAHELELVTSFMGEGLTFATKVEMDRMRILGG